MNLYRLNLELSQELFTVISCFEVALRNAINKRCIEELGNDWLRKGTLPDGIFDNKDCIVTSNLVTEALINLNNEYTHDKLVAFLGFGFWRYLFAPYQFNATGRCLLKIFPERPSSSKLQQFNHTYVFRKLRLINLLRNRIAHHEPICFKPRESIISTAYARARYENICELLKWMSIDKNAYLYGLYHVLTLCDKIDALYPL